MHLRTAVALSLWPASFRPANVAAWQRQAGSTRPRPNPPGVSEADVDAVLARAAAQAIEPVAWSDERYPTALRAIFDPPPLIWLRGNSNALGGVSVGIVGSRRASVYGLQVAEQLSHELATYGITVVSGLARGADAAAHRGALTARGATTAVLGSGCDVMYPPEHAGLAAEMLARGAIVSEFPPGTPPRRSHFPRRNRIISGLSLAVVVVEAAERSGMLITARCGLEQGREVMAVPGNVLSGASRGCHVLIEDGAKLVEGVTDILEELRIDRAPVRSPMREPPTDRLLQRLELGRSHDLDELEALTGVSGAGLLPRLTTWKLDGAVARMPGGRFVRSRGKVVT